MLKRLKTLNKRPSPKVVGITVLAFMILGAALIIFTKAATPNAGSSLTPSTSNVNNGSSFTVAVREDSNTQAVFSVGLKLTYDATKLDLVSVTNTNGAFPNCPDLSGSAGLIEISCYILPTANPDSVTGSQLIANLTFTAKVGGSTSTMVSFVGPATADYGIFSAIDGSNVWDGNVTTNKGTYTLLTPDTTPPVVSISAPSNGATVNGTVAVNATASDNSGTVTKVEFYVNGALKASDSQSPYTYSWDTTASTPDGSYALTAKAYDAATSPNVGTSSTVNVTVQNNKPNLIVDSISSNPASFNTGASVSWSAVIKNNGTAAITAGTSKVVTISVDNVVLSSVTDTQAIPVNGSITVNFTTAWTAVMGSHNILVAADKTNQINEVSEVDNDLTKSITVYTPGDTNGSGTVTLADLNVILLNWDKTGQTRAQGDLTGDGKVTLADINQVLLNWTN